MKQTSLKLALALMCAAPLAALADGPTSRPVNRPGGDRGDRAGMHPFRPGGPPRAPVSNDQWNDVLAFMREHSPKRTEELENLLASADDKRVNFLKQLVTAQYEYVNSLKAEDSELYDLQVSKIEAQDNIYGMLRDSKRNGMSDEQKKEFREQVTKLVDVNLNERKRRIDRAKDSLAKAEATLDNDQKHKSALVDDRVDQFMKEGPGKFKMDDAPPGGGPRSPGDQGASAAPLKHQADLSVLRPMDVLLVASFGH